MDPGTKLFFKWSISLMKSKILAHSGAQESLFWKKDIQYHDNGLPFDSFFF